MAVLNNVTKVAISNFFLTIKKKDVLLHNQF